MRYQSLRPQPLIIVFIFASIVFVSAIGQAQTPPQVEPALSYGLVIDNSLSLRSALDQIVVAAKIIVAHNRPGDETFVVRFTDRTQIQRLQSFTRDNKTLIDVIDRLYLSGGQTAILDAVYQSAQYLAQSSASDASVRRRALILITDGEDRQSRHALADVLQLLHEKNIHVYVVGLVAQLEKDEGKKAWQKASSLLTNLASATGGQAFFPESRNELTANADDMLKVIRIR